MNRIVIVGLFTALKELCKKKEFDSIERIVDAVLSEAQQVPKKPSKQQSDDNQSKSEE